eukprot:2956858-Prymnesium_polylepis.1
MPKSIADQLAKFHQLALHFLGQKDLSSADPAAHVFLVHLLCSRNKSTDEISDEEKESMGRSLNFVLQEREKAMNSPELLRCLEHLLWACSKLNLFDSLKERLLTVEMFELLRHFVREFFGPILQAVVDKGSNQRTPEDLRHVCKVRLILALTLPDSADLNDESAASNDT